MIESETGWDEWGRSGGRRPDRVGVLGVFAFPLAFGRWRNVPCSFCFDMLDSVFGIILYLGTIHQYLLTVKLEWKREK